MIKTFIITLLPDEKLPEITIEVCTVSHLVLHLPLRILSMYI
jgi:hypothetical protein